MARPKVRIAAAAMLGMIAAAAAALVLPVKRSPGDSPAVAATTRPMEIGMNLGGMRYWSQEFAFADLVAASEIKVVQPSGWVDPQGIVPLDSTGHPRDVPVGTRLMVILKSGGGDRLPAGTYDCIVSPGWIVKVSTAARIRGEGENFTMIVGPARNPARLNLELTPRAAGANLDKLTCRDRAVAPGQAFGKAFLADTHPFTVLRFMDWMKTNNQPPQDWSRRTTPQVLIQRTGNLSLLSGQVFTPRGDL